jgi:shikimate kinase
MRTVKLAIIFVDPGAARRVLCGMEHVDSRIRRIALIGMPASGKSSVGALLAELEALPFVDLDDEIADEAGMTISDIFADEGEPGFRTRERVALANVVARGSMVLATGGGCVESAENRALLRERCLIVWLKADLKVLARRSVGGTRPLLVDDAHGKIQVLYERRRPLFEACGGLMMQTDGMRPAMIARAIHDALR